MRLNQILKTQHVTLCPNLMTAQSSKEKISHSYKELIRRITKFEFEKQLPLKSPKIKVAKNIVTTG